MDTKMNKEQQRELENLLTDDDGYLDVEVVSLVKEFIGRVVAEAIEQHDAVFYASTKDIQTEGLNPLSWGGVKGEKWR